jgi:hypothetical protein
VDLEVVLEKVSAVVLETHLVGVLKIKIILTTIMI